MMKTKIQIQKPVTGIVDYEYRVNGEVNNLRWGHNQILERQFFL